MKASDEKSAGRFLASVLADAMAEYLQLVTS